MYVYMLLLLLTIYKIAYFQKVRKKVKIIIWKNCLIYIMAEKLQNFIKFKTFYIQSRIKQNDCLWK